MRVGNGLFGLDLWTLRDELGLKICGLCSGENGVLRTRQIWCHTR